MIWGERTGRFIVLWRGSERNLGKEGRGTALKGLGLELRKDEMVIGRRLRFLNAEPHKGLIGQFLKLDYFGYSGLRPRKTRRNLHMISIRSVKLIFYA
jgi:hypothetical protein